MWFANIFYHVKGVLVNYFLGSVTFNSVAILFACIFSSLRNVLIWGDCLHVSTSIKILPPSLKTWFWSGLKIWTLSLRSRLILINHVNYYLMLCLSIPPFSLFEHTPLLLLFTHLVSLQTYLSILDDLLDLLTSRLG